MSLHMGASLLPWGGAECMARAGPHCPPTHWPTCMHARACARTLMHACMPASHNPDQGTVQQAASTHPELQGLNRTPVAGAPTLSMSCSDKLARWGLLGCQGALLSTVLASPLYIDCIIIGLPLQGGTSEAAPEQLFRATESAAYRAIAGGRIPSHLLQAVTMPRHCDCNPVAGSHTATPSQVIHVHVTNSWLGCIMGFGAHAHCTQQRNPAVCSQPPVEVTAEGRAHQPCNDHAQARIWPC